MSSQIGVGVIGIGILGSRHARVYQEQEATTLIAVADKNPAKGGEHATKLGVKFFGDYGELVRTLGPQGSGQIQAVSVATPDHAHYDVVKACLEGGLDVFVEKPLTMSVGESRSLIALA